MNYLDMVTLSQRNLPLFCTDISLFFWISLKIRARLCFAHPNQYWIVGKDPSNLFHSFLWSVIQRETKRYCMSVKFLLVLQCHGDGQSTVEEWHGGAFKVPVVFQCLSLLSECIFTSKWEEFKSLKTDERFSESSPKCLTSSLDGSSVFSTDSALVNICFGRKKETCKHLGEPYFDKVWG